MALPLKSGADLYNQQAIRMRLHNLGADPLSDFGAGQIYFNTSTESDTAKHVRVYDGTSFRSLAFYDEIANNEEFNALVGRVGTLETMLNTQDAEGVINTWNEIQTFLDSVQEGTDLMDLLNDKLSKRGGTIEDDSVYPLSLNNISEGATNIGMQLKVNGTTKGLLLAGGDWGVAILNPTNSTYALGIKDDNTPYFGTSSTKYTLLHSGNIGDATTIFQYRGNVPTGGVDAAFNNLNSGSYALVNDYTGAPRSGYGTLVQFQGVESWISQFAMYGNTEQAPRLYFRRGTSGEADGATDWKQIAFTDSNVAGLAHPTSGTVGATANEDGSITLNGKILRDASSNRILLSNANELFIGTSDISNYKTYIYGYNLYLRSGETPTNGLILNSSGNVLIGTDADSGEKLQVFGNIIQREDKYGEGHAIYHKVHSSNSSRYAQLKYNFSSYAVFLGLDIESNEGVLMSVNRNDIALNKDTTISGNLHVTGNIIADGEVSAGGAGAEGSGSGGGASVHQEVFTPSTTTVGINHNLGTEDVIITLYEKDSSSSRWSVCLTDIEIVDTNNIDITFGSTSSVQHKVVIMAASA